MAHIAQLDLFINEQRQREVEENEQHKETVKRSLKGLFARYNEMEFVLLHMNKKLDRLNDEVFKEIKEKEEVQPPSSSSTSRRIHLSKEHFLYDSKSIEG